MNNIVSITDGRPVTTSLAVAEGVGNPHATVIKLIRQNIGDLQEFGPLGFEIQMVNRPQGGGMATEYAVLNEQQATLLMTYMRNNDVVRSFKKRLVKAFYEFARGETPRSFAEALRLAADQAERLEAQQAKIQQDAPKVEFHDQVAECLDTFSVKEAAQTLDTGQNRLMKRLRTMKWVNRYNEPYQRVVDQGLLDVKVHTFEHPINGPTKHTTTRITGKGLARLQQVVSGEQAA